MVQFLCNTIMAHAFRKKNIALEYLILKRSAEEIVYANVWQCITGTIDNDETALQTVLRELKEETSLNYLKIFNLPYLAQFFNYNRNTVNFSPCFAFEIIDSEEVTISEDHSDYKWLKLEQALEYLLIPSHKESLLLLNDLLISGKLYDVFEIKTK